MKHNVSQPLVLRLISVILDRISGHPTEAEQARKLNFYIITHNLFPRHSFLCLWGEVGLLLWVFGSVFIHFLLQGSEKGKGGFVFLIIQFHFSYGIVFGGKNFAYA